MSKKYSSYILCLLIAIFVVALYTSDFGPLTRLEWKIQDLLYSFRGKGNFSSDIVLLNIDDQTLKQYGQWPWRRDEIADLVAAVGSGQPKTIFLNIFFDPDVTQDTLGLTKILAGQMSWTKNVILLYEIIHADFRQNKISNPKYLFASSIQVNNDLGILDERYTLLAQKVFLPPEELSQYSAGLGFKYTIYDSDRKIRWEPLVMHFDGYYYPSAGLMAATHYLGIPPSSINVHGGEYIMAGNRKIPTDKEAKLFINYNKPGQSFSQISAADLLAEKVDFNILKNKLVIISVTADMVTNYFATPVSPNLLAAEQTANTIENIIHANFINRLDSSPGIDILILFLIGGIFAFILPRVSLLYRMVIIVISLFVLANANFILFNSIKLLTRPLFISLELILLALAGPFLDEDFLSRFGKAEATYPIKKKPAKIPAVVPEIKPNLSGKAKDFKKSEGEIHTAALTQAQKETSQASTAMPTEHMDKEKVKAFEEEILDAENTPTKHKEIEMSRREIPSAAESPRFGTTPSFGLDGQLKRLGRYEIVNELGKGAMGTVYKGIDPAINRNVALKTIRLDFVNDPEELAELKERLFREAQAAGKLSHPNIVTIYDVGTEATLQYIAMEYLEGQTLENMIRHKAKFNFRIIAQIMSQISSALDYAHAQGIVHRDIKPANIMVLSDYSIKVMDFGIARIDSSSMTRTGIAMGTPNYISPEQLQGKPVDHRTDIFSMGIVMYEMLVGRRPFRGENLTALIYAIVNTEPDAPSSIDSSIPPIFDRVIVKALKKNTTERYQKAGEISAALADFIETFSSKKTTSV
jgi:serine/threonine-protein kinase